MTVVVASSDSGIIGMKGNMGIFLIRFRISPPLVSCLRVRSHVAKRRLGSSGAFDGLLGESQAGVDEADVGERLRSVA